MGGHVPMDKDLEDDPRVLALIDVVLEHWASIGVPKALCDVEEPLCPMRPYACDAVLGALFRLWRHADTHLESHNRESVTLRRLAGVTGLPVTVLKKFPRAWLIDHGGEAVELPSYTAKNALITKDHRRENSRRRTARWRKRKREERDASQGVTGDASQRHDRVTTGTGSGSGTETGTTIPGPGPQAGSLASALGRLARRPGTRNGAGTGDAPPRIPRGALKADARALAAGGMPADEVARLLAPHGVDADEARRWLTDPPPESHPQ